MDTFGGSTKCFQAILDQYRAMPQTYQQERAVTSLGSIPLIVVSATTPDDETRRVGPRSMENSPSSLTEQRSPRHARSNPFGAGVEERTCPDNNRCDPASYRGGAHWSAVGKVMGFEDDSQPLQSQVSRGDDAWARPAHRAATSAVRHGGANDQPSPAPSDPLDAQSGLVPVRPGCRQPALSLVQKLSSPGPRSAS